MKNIDDLTFIELKDSAKEMGMEKLAGMNKSKLLSAMKRKLNAIQKKRELEKQLKKVEKKPFKVKLLGETIEEFKIADLNILGKEEPKLPMYDNLQVVKVLDSRHTNTHFHCLMANGSTVHVPKKLF